MRFFKKIIIKTIHSLGYDIIKIPNDYDNPFGGLTRFPIRTIIDIGANQGQFAKKAIKAFPKAHFCCVEPVAEPFKELKEWADSQGLNKITAFNMALGDKEGEKEMFLHLDHNDSSSFLKSTKNYEKLYPITQKQVKIPVKLTTLDKLAGNLPEPLLPEILIKIDVEGYEDRVIQGGRKTLEDIFACIIEISLDYLREEQSTFPKIFSLMAEMKFHYIGNLNQIYAKDGHIIYIDALFIK